MLLTWKLSAAQKQEVVDLYLGGASSCQIGDKFNIKPNAVIGLLVRRGIPRRPRGTLGIPGGLGPRSTLPAGSLKGA